MKMKKPSNFNHQYTPRMLKDFLTDESPNSTVGSNLIIQTDQHLNAGEFEKQIHHLIRRRRRRRTSPSATISAIHAMVNALKNINFGKSPSNGILSRRRSTTICGGDHRQINEPQIKRNLTVKDIIRWKSFRDFPDIDADDKSPTSVLPSSPQFHCTTTTTSTSTATNSPRTSSSSSGSSWCGSDFTAENFNLPCLADGKSEENNIEGEKCLRRVGEEKAEVGPKKSPISAMEITFEENWWSSSFDQTLERINLQKRMFTTRKISITDEFHCPKSTDENTNFTVENTDSADQIYQEEEIEEKTILQLLNNVKDESEKRLVLDLFREEITSRGNEEEMVRRVKEWINGEDKLWIGWNKKDVCVREMEKEYGTKLKEEQEEISMEIHNEMVDDLVDEILLHLIISSSSPKY